ncbi:hypothetical protein HT576_09010 [Haloterrigena sp. SYSU A121-1]|uniref:Uncharacterized protein n=1 Tax=Haloterrigena gelatinilytica TaxID=2741724 RepID=A0A8J8GJJ6_9EURY|nr:hypothetical protein [Haloterrigena gelatinilytica]NUB91159.1 hypothetical protein [Haloterrigena gelatinilytica]
MSKDLRAREIMQKAISVNWGKVQELTTESEYENIDWEMEDGIEFTIMDCLEEDDFDPEIAEKAGQGDT